MKKAFSSLRKNVRKALKRRGNIGVAVVDVLDVPTVAATSAKPTVVASASVYVTPAAYISPSPTGVQRELPNEILVRILTDAIAHIVYRLALADILSPHSGGPTGDGPISVNWERRGIVYLASVNFLFRDIVKQILHKAFNVHPDVPR